jgi:2-dehydropantoate 2-reductase
MLARAGHEVRLIGRPLHVEAINRQGLDLDTQAFRERVRVRAGTDASEVGGADLALVCVKSTDTESAGAAMAPHLARDASVLSLQNGVDNAARLAAVLSHEVVSTVVYVAAEMAGPGHVKHFGRGELVIGPSSASADIAALFGAAGIPAEVSGNVIGALWAKLTINCAYNALSAITQTPYGPLWRTPGVAAVMRDVVRECLAVAHAAGINVPGDPWAAVECIARTMPQQRSSTAQDLARGKRSEIDHLNGLIVRRGEALGIATPANRVLHVLVRRLEERSAESESA